MRTIKFRGKRIDNGDWAIGSLYGIERHGKLLKIIQDESGIIWHDRDVSTETIGQCTGLKDKNGKEIYEGDVIEMEERFVGDFIHKKEKAAVEWFEDGACFSINGKDCVIMYDGYWHTQCEVVGNIYE